MSEPLETGQMKPMMPSLLSSTDAGVSGEGAAL
jgi:hypothetical protein